MLESPGGCPQRSIASGVNHRDAGNNQRLKSVGTVSPGVQRPWVFPQQQHRHLDVQQVRNMDNDVESNQSGDISNADSGRGASEEGDPLSRAGWLRWGELGSPRNVLQFLRKRYMRLFLLLCQPCVIVFMGGRAICRGGSLLG